MRRSNTGSISLSAVAAFIEVAEFASYSEAAIRLNVSRTTVMRKVLSLEIWLHRALIFSEELFLTPDGDEFVSIAAQALCLVYDDNLQNDLKKARIHGDGNITIEGETINTRNAAQIGKLIAGFRANTDGFAKPRPRISGNDPLIAEFLSKHFSHTGGGDSSG